MKNTLKKLFKGEYNLAKSYWFFGNIIPLLLFLLILGVIFGFSNHPLEKLKTINFVPETTLSLILTLILSVITLIYIVISTIGVWRSASKHTGGLFWAWAAKITIVIAFASYLNDIRRFLFPS